jgi:hypothetical protein
MAPGPPSLKMSETSKSTKRVQIASGRRELRYLAAKPSFCETPKQAARPGGSQRKHAHENPSL